MKFMSYRRYGAASLAVDADDAFVGLSVEDAGYPGDLLSLLAQGGDALAMAGDALRARGRRVEPAEVELLPPVMPGKILCVGLNYADHAAESNMQVPAVPTIFSRFASSIVASGEPIRLPRVSSTLDYEGELAVIVGAPGRYIAKDAALEHVAGYSVFNDASIREYQLRTPQWTIGKNFDGTGPFGAGHGHRRRAAAGRERPPHRDPPRRRDHAELVDRPADLRRGDPCVGDQRGDGNAAGRRHHHRDAGGSRGSPQAATLHAAGRAVRGRDRGDRHPVEPDRRR